MDLASHSSSGDRMDSGKIKHEWMDGWMDGFRQDQAQTQTSQLSFPSPSVSVYDIYIVAEQRWGGWSLRLKSGGWRSI